MKEPWIFWFTMFNVPIWCLAIWVGFMFFGIVGSMAFFAYCWLFGGFLMWAMSEFAYPKLIVVGISVLWSEKIYNWVTEEKK